MKQQKAYGNESISSLKGADRVRLRPAVIFGSDGLEGCEHAVFEILSNAIDEAREGYGRQIFVTRYEDHSIEVEDFGCYSTESVDYAVYGAKVAHCVADGKADYGVLVCSTGIGISMAANKVKGIRAALCSDTHAAEMTRRHNNANVLCLGGLVTEEKTALEIVDTFLKFDFEGGRHQRRIDQIADIENGRL